MATEACGVCLCVVQVLQAYEELLGGGGRSAALKVHTSVTLTLVWLWVTLYHLPCLVVWSKTRRSGTAPSLFDITTRLLFRGILGVVSQFHIHS